MVLHEAGAGVRGTPALHFQQVEFRYTPDAPPALSGVELVVHSGDIVAVVGRNGSGKSTLARLANGLLRPRHGCVRVGDYDTRDDGSLRFIRARVGIVFQDPDSQIVGSSVGDDVAFGLENLGVPRMEMKMRVAAALEAVGLPGMESVPVGQLSGAKDSVWPSPGCWLWNPASSLWMSPLPCWIAHTECRCGACCRLAARGTAVLWITQHMEEALWAGRLVALEAGRVAYEGILPSSLRVGQISWSGPASSSAAGSSSVCRSLFCRGGGCSRKTTWYLCCARAAMLDAGVSSVCAVSHVQRRDFLARPALAEIELDILRGFGGGDRPHRVRQDHAA